MKYTAFISYNSKDDKWAEWLQRKLEAFRQTTIELIALFTDGYRLLLLRGADVAKKCCSSAEKV